MEIMIDIQTYSLIFKILFSLSTGLIIGLEREHRTKEETFAGIRTFPPYIHNGNIISIYK